MQKTVLIILSVLVILSAASCGAPQADTEAPDAVSETEEAAPEAEEEDAVPEVEEEADAVSEEENVEDSVEASEAEEETAEESLPRLMDFVDVYGNEHTLVVDETADMNDYATDCFVLDGQHMTYTDSENYTYSLGIDVSYHQGVIDWESVKDDGYDFAFIRIGYRGYGEGGKLVEDEDFRTNLEGAAAAGLEVGVYFFSQAVSEEEALEEAAFVLGILGDAKLDLPVVYDPEFILDGEGNRIDGARTSLLEGGQVTQNALAFCGAVGEAGYEAAFYTNMLSESEVFDMTAMSGYTVWYADYCEVPQTPYGFEFWQYTESGTVSGISGYVDLDIRMIPAG